jgi:hypothetical protein
MEPADWSGVCKLLSDDTVSTVHTEIAIINKHVEQKGTDKQAADDTGNDTRKLGVISQKHKVMAVWRPDWEGKTQTELQY